MSIIFSARSICPRGAQALRGRWALSPLWAPSTPGISISVRESLTPVERSLQENDHTVVSIYVNPSQFAPHEDLASYPRTLDADTQKLQGLRVAGNTVDAIFAPSLRDMYPHHTPPVHETPFTDLDGTFVQVQGLGNVLEGASRPSFFKGVATVVTKLFNVVRPVRAYFGQKDIQQALVLRRMLSDLLVQHPLSENLVIVPTVRDSDGLALSSRNSYLSPTERAHAPLLYAALSAAQSLWDQSVARPGHTSENQSLALDVCSEAHRVFAHRAQSARAHGVSVDLLYMSINDIDSFKDLAEYPSLLKESRGAFISAACKVGTTRLIDNVLLTKA